MTANAFRKELQRLMNEAKEKGCKYIDITSGEVHRNVGGYPGKKHRMPSCCEVIKSMKKVNDEIINEPTKGNGASLTIRYIIDR